MTSDRLRRVVRIRKLMENSRAVELGRSQTQLREARRELDEAGQRLNAHDEDVQSIVFDPLLEESAIRYRERLAEGERSQARDVAQQVDLVASTRRSVEVAHRDRRLMEGLHDRVRARELQSMAEREAKTHDAQALSSHVRKGSSDR